MTTLSFATVEPVRFGSFEAMPEKLVGETKLRVQALKFKTEADLSEAIEVLSSCFGEKAGQVKEFMVANMFSYDLQRLQSYLVGGPGTLKNMDDAFSEAIASVIKESKNAAA